VAWWVRLWDAPLAVKLHWILRIGVAAEFFGHGLAGLYRSPAWIPYFTLFGFSKQFSHDHLFYVTGSFDILMAALVLLRPMRAAMLYMAVWGMFTAWLRPITGESWFELVERGANYGMPAAFLLLSGWGGATLRPWFERVGPSADLSEDVARRLAWVMQGGIALLLIGHGGLGLVADKKEWFDFFRWFGISAASVSAHHLMQSVGLFEVALGVAVLVKPWRGLLLFILVWKVGTELLRPLVGQPNFQFIERAGDYVLPVTLLWVLVWLRSVTNARPPVAVRTAVATPAPAARPQPARVRVAPMPASGSLPVPPTPAASGPDPDVLAAAAALNARLAARRADPTLRTSRLLVLNANAPTSSS
jgi:hypothetical protein